MTVNGVTTALRFMLKIVAQDESKHTAFTHRLQERPAATERSASFSIELYFTYPLMSGDWRPSLFLSSTYFA